MEMSAEPGPAGGSGGGAVLSCGSCCRVPASLACGCLAARLPPLCLCFHASSPFHKDAHAEFRAHSILV